MNKLDNTSVPMSEWPDWILIPGKIEYVAVNICKMVNKKIKPLEKDHLLFMVRFHRLWNPEAEYKHDMYPQMGIDLCKHLIKEQSN